MVFVFHRLAFNQESPSQVKLGPPGQVNQEPSKESLLTYLNKLFPERKQKKKSSRECFPKVPALHTKVWREVREFCRWLDTFGDMGIDEEQIMKQFEIDYKCTPTHNTGKIKKITQDPFGTKPQQTAR